MISARNCGPFVNFTLILFSFSCLIQKCAVSGWALGLPAYKNVLKNDPQFQIHHIRHTKDFWYVVIKGRELRQRSVNSLASSTPIDDGMMVHEDALNLEGTEVPIDTGDCNAKAKANENKSDFLQSSWIRLAEFLVNRQENLVLGKKVTIIGISWISSMLNQLEPANVIQYTDDIDDTETRAAVLPQNEMSLLRQEVRDELVVLKANQVQVETKMVDDLEENGNDAIIILATASTALIEDPFVNDFLRHTSSTILMDSDMVDIFCYHPRIQEGADIILW